MKTLIVSSLMSPRRSKFVAFAMALLVGAGVAMITPVRAEPPKTVESQTAATAGKPVLVVSDSGKSQTVDGEGRDVSIDGDKNDVIIHGKCHALIVSGNENTVHAEALATISTPGNKNFVTWTEAVDGEKPQITDVGHGNSIEHSPK